MTRIQVGDYDTWKRMFDKDVPGARRSARSLQIYRGLEDPNEVFIQIGFASADEAKMGRDRLIASKVLDRFSDKTGPTVVEEADA
jgi:hypothetical protein